RRIIMAMLAEAGTELRPWADGPMVRALRVEQVRAEFFKAHYADGETERARQNAKRMAFGRAIEAAREKGRVVTRELRGVRSIWLARAADEAQATTVRIAGRKPADDPAPAQTLDGSASVASVAAFLSNSVKEQLRGFGCTEEYILHVLPEDAHA